MAQLFRRTWSLTVGTLLIRPIEGGVPLDLSFEVERSTDRTPNTAVVTIYNLGRERRQGIAAPVELQLEVGYEDAGSSVIFSGRARRVERGRRKNRGLVHQRKDVDVETIIEAEDGGDGYRDAELNRSYSSGTPVASVLEELVRAMGLGAGNLSQHSSSITAAGSAAFADAVRLSGPARRSLDRILRAADYDWSIQHGAIQVRRRGQPAETRALRLSPGTGLVGSPSIDADGKVLATSLLIPGLYPGRVVRLESSEVSGNYHVTKCHYRGSTFDDAWHAELTMERY